MSSEAKVGLVIAAWNAERWMGEALASVLAQSVRPVDVVVVDDGSSDRTGEIAEGFGPPVRVVRQANGGIGAARNLGLGHVRGELVTFLDADDLLTPNSLGCRVQALADREDLDVVFGSVREFSEIHAGTPVALGERRSGHLPTAMLVRREAIERVGDFATDTHVAEGLDWLLRTREAGLAELIIEEQVIWRRIHGENNSVRHRGEIGEYARALKASLDRRRAAVGTDGPRPAQ